MYVPSACEFRGDREWAVDRAPASISCSLQRGYLLFDGMGSYNLLTLLDPAHPLRDEAEAIRGLQSHTGCDLCCTGAPVPHHG